MTKRNPITHIFSAFIAQFAININITPPLKPVDSMIYMCCSFKCAKMGNNVTMDDIEELLLQVLWKNKLIKLLIFANSYEFTINNFVFEY